MEKVGESGVKTLLPLIAGSFDRDTKYSLVHETDDINCSDDQTDADSSRCQCKGYATRRDRRRSFLFKVAAGLTLYLLGVFTMFLMRPSNKFVTSRLNYSPAAHVASYEPRIAYPLAESEHVGWKGLPTQETNDTWTEIATYKTMVLPREELERAGENLTRAMELKAGGFPSLLGVFHELHCVNELRWYMYKDVYYPDMTREEEEDKLEHLDHCIDILRESVSCTGDLTVYSFQLMDTRKGPRVKVTTNGQRQCLSLEPMIEWVRSTQKGNEEAIGVPKVA